MKKFVRLFLLIPTTAALVMGAGYLSFKAIEQSIIEENEVLVHSMAHDLLPILLSNDEQQIQAYLQSLESRPGIQAAELVSNAGIPVASYVREGFNPELGQESFALASADDFNPDQLRVMAPLTFDTQILANLHVVVSMWPAYMQFMKWIGLLLILPSCLYVLFWQMRIKVRFERINAENDHHDGSGGEFDVKKALGGALSDSDISIDYQPIRRLSDQGIFGLEVLVCWRHPSGQTLHVSPGDFIALAESNGICLPFRQWVLEKACAQAAQWQHRYGPLVLALNISPSQLKDAEFYQQIRTICASVQYPHQLIEFEVSEAALLRQGVDMSDVEAFVQHGMSLTIDRFGLSERSADLLQSMAIAKVKFDAQLLKNIAKDNEMCAHVSSLAALAMKRDVQILADGLTSKDQMQVMTQMGCIMGQGSIFEHPMSPMQITQLLGAEAKKEFARQQRSLGAPLVNGSALSF
jgi:EAL domain-containing protein (putative c-di-GMP-specific phosphodiesterase class I)